MLRKNKIFYNFEPTRLIGGTQKDMLGIPYVLNVSGTLLFNRLKNNFKFFLKKYFVRLKTIIYSC